MQGLPAFDSGFDLIDSERFLNSCGGPFCVFFTAEFAENGRRDRRGIPTGFEGLSLWIGSENAVVMIGSMALPVSQSKANRTGGRTYVYERNDTLEFVVAGLVAEVAERDGTGGFSDEIQG